MSPTPGLAIKSSYVFIFLSSFPFFANVLSNLASETHRLVCHGTGGGEAVCPTLIICPSRSLFCSFCPVLYEAILAPLPSGSWMDGANGRDLEEVRGRKWSEVRVSALPPPPAPSPPDQEHGSGYILLPSARVLFNSYSSECTLGALSTYYLFLVLSPLFISSTKPNESSICFLPGLMQATCN